MFAAGIIGTGMLAVPVIAGSSAYALGEAFGWSVGLARLPLDAKAFYGAVAVATLIGVFINFVDINPIKALFWSTFDNIGRHIVVSWDGKSMANKKGDGRISSDLILKHVCLNIFM